MLHFVLSCADNQLKLESIDSGFQVELPEQ